MKAIISFLIITTLSVQHPVPQNDYVKGVKESVFLTLERTPCFGKCPHYKIIIFNTGNVEYQVLEYSEKTGKHTKRLTIKELKEIESLIDEINLFELKNKYDSGITDIPSCYLFVNFNGKKKKILDRDGAPEKLKRLEKLIDFLVIDDELKKVSE